MHTDPIADMLTRIRNANRALHENVEMPSSRLVVAALLFLVDLRLGGARTAVGGKRHS